MISRQNFTRTDSIPHLNEFAFFYMAMEGSIDSIRSAAQKDGCISTYGSINVNNGHFLWIANQPSKKCLNFNLSCESKLK